MPKIDLRCQFAHVYFVIFILATIMTSNTRADVFNMEPGLTSLEFVTVDNPGNAPDPNFFPVGSVPYSYRIGKYEITAGQYTEFLNAVAKDDPNQLYDASMGDPVGVQGANIQRIGSSPDYSYSVDADWENRPVNFVSLWDAARFANWLHNGQPTGPQGLGTTEDGAYVNIGSQATFARQPGAKFFIPTENEWYKAAYHDKNAGLAANYFDYPMGTNSIPGNDLTESSNAGNNANYLTTGHVIDSPYFRTVVGRFALSDSPYGTFDQGGNLWEWNEVFVSVSARGVRGGAYFSFETNLRVDYRLYLNPALGANGVGFRVAGVVPEPSGVLLGLLGLLAALLRPRRLTTR